MSRSELHNWECVIEALCGDNADKMLDIAQDIYNTAFVRGKDCMSSVTPQRPKGKWRTRHYVYPDKTLSFKVCNKCGYEFSYDAETGISDAKYCPFCGADMRESEE